jgi:chemotaxis family two-component system sensor kinase Cph1
MALEPMQDDRRCGQSAAGFRASAADDGRDRQSLPLREADHRIKNSLSIVASTLKLQRERISGVEAVAALDDSVARIMAVADIHRALQICERPGTVPIASTPRELCNRLGRMRSELDLGCMADDEILMEASHAIPLSLVVSELLLNAVKYAYPPGDPGVITVGGRLTDGVLLITVTDHGAGMPTAISSTDHLGQRMVRSFCQELGATIDFKTLPQRGTVVSIRVPLRPGGAPQDAPDEPSTD